MYRVGFPGWKIAARFRVNLLVTIDVLHDKEAGVYIATSGDLPGLVVETKTIEDLFPEVYDCVGMLLAKRLKHAPKRKPVAAWSGDICPA